MVNEEAVAEPWLKRKWHRLARNTFVEPPLAEDALTLNMDAAGRPILGFYIMLGLATIIGTSGLLANSAGVIIGAMIVAPLMNPIVALSYCLARSNWRQARQALILLVSGVILTVLLAYIGTQILGLRVVGSEILSRTQPTLLDLGVAVAAGAAVAFASSRKSIANVLPGTAIAVALVPPLCVVGVGLGTGGELVPEAGLAYLPLGSSATGIDVAYGAAILFVTNLAGIVLAAEFVFFLNGYGSLRKAVLGLIVTLVAAVILCYPLGISLRNLYSRSEAMKVASALMAERSAEGGLIGTILDIRVTHDGDLLTIDLKGIAPESGMAQLEERVGILHSRLEDALGEPVLLRAEGMVVPLVRFTVEPSER